MPDWDIDLSAAYDEPTHVPTGDECEHAARGENCGRTDCPDCGEDAAAWLCAQAIASTGGVVALACEVRRVSGSSAQYAVTGRDLARVRDRWRPERSHKTWSRAWAWAEGVLDAVSGRPAWLQRHDYEHDVSAQAAYMIGRLLVELYLANEHLTALEARTMAAPSPREQLEHERCRKAERTTLAQLAELRLPQPSAAGASSAPSAIPTHGSGHAVDSGPGFESRAQHRARSGC